MNKNDGRTDAQEAVTKHPDGTLNWPNAGIYGGLHSCIDYPHLPCGACLSVKYEEALKGSG
jgi:hypothetical protein